MKLFFVCLFFQESVFLCVTRMTYWGHIRAVSVYWLAYWSSFNCLNQCCRNASIYAQLHLLTELRYNPVSFLSLSSHKKNLCGLCLFGLSLKQLAKACYEWFLSTHDESKAPQTSVLSTPEKKFSSFGNHRERELKIHCLYRYSTRNEKNYPSIF